MCRIIHLSVYWLCVLVEFGLSQTQKKFSRRGLRKNSSAENEDTDEEEEESDLEIRDEPHAWKWILGMMLVMGSGLPHPGGSLHSTG